MLAYDSSKQGAQWFGFLNVKDGAHGNTSHGQVELR